PVGTRVNGEKEIASMDDVPILEVYSGQCAADLGAQLDLLDPGKLTEEAQPGLNLTHERLAHHNLRKGRGSHGGGAVSLTIRIGEPCSRDNYRQGRNCAGKHRALGGVLVRHRNRSPVKCLGVQSARRCAWPLAGYRPWFTIDRLGDHPRATALARCASPW